MTRKTTPASRSRIGRLLRPATGYAALKPFRHRDFRLLWVALAISMVGDGIWLIAIPWQVIELGGGPGALGVVIGSGSVGILVSLFFGGVLADALPRRTILWVTTIGSFLVVAALLALSVSGLLSVGAMAVAAFLLAACDGLTGPCIDALIPTLLPAEELQAANGLESFLSSIAARAIGPAIGGVVVALAGTEGALLIDAVSFLLAGAGYFLLHGGRDGAAGDAGALRPRSIVRNFRDGAGFVASQRWLWCGIGWAGLALLVQTGARQVLLPFLVIREYAGAASDFGLILAVYGVGAVLGALLAASVALPRRYLSVMFLVWSAGSVPFAFLPFLSNFVVAAVLMGMAGVFLSWGNVIWSTLLQRRVPDELRGRVSSFDWFGSLALLPVSMAVAGGIGNSSSGVALMFLASGLVPPLLAVAVMVVGGLRRDETTHPLASGDAGGSAGSDGSADRELAGS